MNEEEIQEMMKRFVEHVKDNHINAGALVEALGVSYPQLLNSLRGEMPEGEVYERTINFFQQSKIIFRINEKI